MRGRKPKPAAIRQAQGNPGKRAIVDVPAAAPSAEPQKRPAGTGLSPEAQRAYDLIAPELRRMNFVRSTDEQALMRYATTLAYYWNVTHRLDELLDTNLTRTVIKGDGEVVIRPAAEFFIQERLDRRLHMYEDRFGLTPAARQQLLVRLAAKPPELPLGDPKSGDGEKKAAAPPPAASAVGMLNRHAIN